MSDTEYSLKLTGNGVTVERKISAQLGERVAMLIISDGKAHVDNDAETIVRKDAAGETHGGTKPTPIGRLSLREYINSHNAKQIPQQIVAIGSYFQAKNGTETFTRDELQNGFQTGKVPPPGNLPRDIATTISRGWIAEADEDDQYYVTSTGEIALASNFAKEVGKATGGRRRKRRNKMATTK